ncbi:F-box/LRR-repeat protein 20 [Echinococcus granulosus]|uniref:F-box/LRR-repeat protein 20 n=2 Tax=Echinococcus granulosus TaxID=6210 RepID=W6V9K3_ECHGR|nr:F-box/LRR-repeat protein 20 [Echinococcus granulosus]EUB63324.1 F-box/LRR-repeat protein 20 [Echinococcus granulosus]
MYGRKGSFLGVTQNLQRRLSATVGHEGVGLPATSNLRITKLPEKLLLRIFSFLTHRELCTIARVSKQWRRLAYDESQWSCLNLRPEHGGLSVPTVEDFLNLVNQRSGEGLRYLELNSDLITIPVLEELGNKCTNLRYLTLDFSNAMQLHDFNDLMAFPGLLTYLCICLSDVIFMEGLMRKIYPCLSSLEVLHLIGTFERAAEEEEEIYEVVNISKIRAHTPNLRVINLYGISFVDDSHVELLATNCLQLECIALNYCLNVKGAAFPLIISNCKKLKTLLLCHCGLEDEYIMQVPWENSQLCELDITSTELSSECLDSFLSRIPSFTYLAAGHTDFLNDKLRIHRHWDCKFGAICFSFSFVLRHLVDLQKFNDLIALDLSFTPSLSESTMMNFLQTYGSQLRGLMLQGKPTLAEYFWTTVITFLHNIEICVLGSPDGWFFKYNTRVHVDQVLHAFALNCPNLTALEIQWDPETLRFSDKSRKFIDRLRLKCWRLKSLTLCDGKYYELVKGNFERAERPRVVRTSNSYTTSIVSLLCRYKDLQFN